MTPRNIERLEDARDACLRARTFVSCARFEDFVASDLLRSAVERQLEIIGEALGIAAREDGSVGRMIPDLPRIVGLRNRLIHGYDVVDPEIIWDVIQTNIPQLQHQLDSCLNDQET